MKEIVRKLLMFTLVTLIAWPACQASAATPQTAAASLVFDFDSGLPTLSPGRPTPFNQTVGNVTASFTSLFDPSAFSVQSYETTFFMLSNFSGNFLYDNNLATRSVDIRFNGQLTSIAFTFATIEYHGGAGSEPSNLTLKAYLDTVGATPVGSATARGTWPEGNSFPQGKLSFDSAGQPFNLVRIELPFQGPKGASDFLMDNITVKVLGGSTDPGTPGGNGGDNSTTTEPPPDTSGGTNPTDGFSQPLLMALSLAVVAVLVAAVIMRLRGR